MHLNVTMPFLCGSKKLGNGASASLGSSAVSDGGSGGAGGALAPPTDPRHVEPP